MRRNVQNGVVPFRLRPCRSDRGNPNRTLASTVVGLLTVGLLLVTTTYPVQGGIIVKRQAEDPTTTSNPIEDSDQFTPDPTTRSVEFESNEASTPHAIEFGYDIEKNASSELGTVAELNQAAVETTEPTEIAPASMTVAPSIAAPKAPPTRPDAPTTVVAPTRGASPSSTEPAGQTLARHSWVAQAAATEISAEEVEKDDSREVTTEEPLSETTTVASATEEFEVLDSRPVVEEQKDDTSKLRFELDRYTSPSNFSQGGISLDETRIEREQFFDDKSAATTESPDSYEATTLPDSFSSSEEGAESATESNELVVVPEALAERNHTIESNRTVFAEKLEVEHNDYELVSNEVRVQNQTGSTGKGKKGKFLDQFGATEDNNINGAAWALAGMRIVDRASSKAGQISAESVDVIRDENENTVANNTLKQLMDWAMIMQDADFANSSFVKPTVPEPEIELKNEIKDRRKYANKTPPSIDALSEENRITSVVTELIPEPSRETTTIMPNAKLVVGPTSTTEAEDDDLEDFKFEDRSKVPTQTTKRPELTNFIQETTTPFMSKNDHTVTTIRPTRGYEVSENVDENESFALPERTTTTGKYESSTTVDDMPVTTYSPASPIMKKTEVTTEAILPTTFESMRPTRRPFIITTTQEPITTNSVKFFEETTPLVTTTTTSTSTSSLSPPTSEENDTQINSLPRSSDEQISSEVDANAINQTNEELSSRTRTTTTSAPTTLSIHSDPFLTQQSTLQPISYRPSTGTTDKVDFSTESAEEPTIPNHPVLVDDKNVYDTVSETTPPPFPPTESSVSSESDPATSTRQSIERLMTTTAELSEEESVTEEDYVDLNSSATGSSSRAPLDRDSSLASQSPPEQEAEEGNGGVVIAVVASLVSVIVVLLLVAAFLYYPQLQLIFRKRQAQVSYGQRCRPVGLDAYSLDNVSVYNSVRRKGNTMRMSKRSYGNSAFEDPGLKTNPLTVAELANIIQNKTAIYDEFKEIPNVTARADEVPEGCEEKNRYANVVPLPETRVHLKRLNDDEKTEYINANFVKGPKDNTNYYIACQAPMENTINDFWRMIWEQNSKVIIMATDLSENGVEKCAEYLPPSVVLDNNRTFGDFQLTLKNRENKEKYTISTVHLRNTQTNTWREIMHFWYQWPDTGVPIDESSIIAMLLEARSYSRLAPGELAEAPNNNNQSNSTTANGTVITSNGISGGITSIAEEPTSIETTESNSVAIGSNNVDSSNNNNNTIGKANSDGVPPPSLISNGGTMDKHKSLQRTQGPITVHCSPGTGRTGTIVACDVALRAVEIPPRTVDIPLVVYYVRRGRASAVRTREQYELIYRVANVYATKLTGPTIET
ncbi:uncharacterized protein LOC134203441 isoform X1 [Armigeres subalbatus]|uniref:uncharacterized protein LOC134203441 isoform X1 n=1 Tax=Armigeres subalbatus TaxID=124917 RepID=UPI002ED6317D